MARTKKTKDSINKIPEVHRNGLHHLEVLSIISRYFCNGHPPAEILELINNEYGIELRREEPWDLLASAANRGWFHYSPPFEMELRGKLRDRYGLDVDVVRTGVSDDVSRCGADALLRFVKARAAMGRTKVHIGFAGGRALMQTARFLADRLRRETGQLPEKIVFHAVVAGFNPENPTTDPNAFFSYFDAETMPVKTGFVGLPAPALLSTHDLKTLSNIKAIKAALIRKAELDIIVTSAGGHWQDGHSGLSRAYRDLDLPVDDAGWIGDMMWQPLSAKGPVDLRSVEPRALTLLTLKELGEFIAADKKVLLLLGPCGECRRPKANVLQAVLNWKSRIVTDLILDSQTAREVVRLAEST